MRGQLQLEVEAENMWRGRSDDKRAALQQQPVAGALSQCAVIALIATEKSVCGRGCPMVVAPSPCCCCAAGGGDGENCWCVPISPRIISLTRSAGTPRNSARYFRRNTGAYTWCIVECMWPHRQCEWSFSSAVQPNSHTKRWALITARLEKERRDTESSAQSNE